MRALLVGLIFVGVSMASFGGIAFGCNASALNPSDEFEVKKEVKKSAIEQAKALWQDEKRLSADVKRTRDELGVRRSPFVSKDVFVHFSVRAFLNDKLRAALLKAKADEVAVFVENYFSVQASFVFIDHRASDEEIIRFLLGDEKSEKKTGNKKKASI